MVFEAIIRKDVGISAELFIYPAGLDVYAILVLVHFYETFVFLEKIMALNAE